VLDTALQLVFPVAVVAALLLAASVLLTGGLHLDGLMDTADGVFGGHTVARRLEIMRDSRTGSYGVLAGVLVVLLKFACLISLPPGMRTVALMLAPLSGRWSMVLCIAFFPYARPEGLGAAFRTGVTRPVASLATLVAFVLATALSVLSGLALWPGPILLLAAGVAAWALASRMAAKLLGLTGDCYGAVNELVESFVLLLLVAFAPALALAPAGPGAVRL
jgi:adenosylcobinamide-GDP ribazoletransferase